MKTESIVGFVMLIMVLVFVGLGIKDVIQEQQAVIDELYHQNAELAGAVEAYEDIIHEQQDELNGYPISSKELNAYLDLLEEGYDKGEIKISEEYLMYMEKEFSTIN